MVTQEGGRPAPAVRARRPVPAPADEDETAIVPRGAGLSRLVLWAGVAAGTALVVLAEWHGVHPRIPGLPRWLGYAAGFAAAWLVLAGLAVWAAALLRTHHRGMARWSWRTSRRAAVAGYRVGRRHSGRLARGVHGRARERWGERGDTWRAPLIITPRDRGDGQDAQDPQEPGAVAVTDDENGGSDTDDMSERITAAVHAAWYGRRPLEPPQTMRTAPGVYEVHLPPGVINPEIAPTDLAGILGETLSRELGIPVKETGARRTPDGAAITLHVPASPAPAPAGAVTNGGTNMPDVRVPAGAVPVHWKGLAAATADFEPASDAEFLEWMSSEVAGILAYGEAVADVHEHCVTAVRADPAAMAALRDVAEAAAEFAEEMARAVAKFKQVYEAPREFVHEGGVLPKDGDWLQGDDD